MLLMTLAFWAYAFAVVFMRARAIVLERERHAAWARRRVRARRADRGCRHELEQRRPNSSPWAATASTSGAPTA